MKYRMMWEALKETAEVMIADGIVGEVSWRTLLDLMQQGEKMFEPEERSNERTFLKPKVDWDNVPVDTLVRVRNDEDSPWVLQYFKEFDEERSYKFLAWSNGRTSKTTGGRLTGWKYCELVEDEDNDK